MREIDKREREREEGEREREREREIETYCVFGCPVNLPYRECPSKMSGDNPL